MRRKPKTNYLEWSQLPYGGEETPPNDGIDPLAESWSTYFIKRRGSRFFGPKGPLQFNIQNPNDIDWESELAVVQETMDHITREQIQIAKFWGTGVATKQWTPIIDRLIDTYGCTPPYASRILAAVEAGLNDTFVVVWHYKYNWNVARPIQYDPDLEPILCTPRFPTYVSGHSAISGCAAVILSYFFPGESEKLNELAEEAAVSRLYGGIHFPIDNEAGLVVGRTIGEAVVEHLKRQTDSSGQPIDKPYQEDLDADLRFSNYDQALPYEFEDKCTSNRKKLKKPRRKRTPYDGRPILFF